MLFRINAKLLWLSCVLCCSNIVHAQKDSLGRKLSEEYTYFSIDSLIFKSKKIELLYTLERKGNMDRKVRDFGDKIFNDSANKISRLYLTENNGKTIAIPTVPLDNIIIDDSKELIVGLSRAVTSPYKIVLYDFNGVLLYKKTLLPFELTMDSVNYIEFCRLFPSFLEYAIREKQILFEGGVCYIDLGYWQFLSAEEKEKIKSSTWFKPSHYFPFLFPESIDGTCSYQLSRYTNFYSMTDPFYEFEMSQSGKPVGIILNDEFGSKVKISIPK